MEWQQIVGFQHVARLGSFTRAAEATFRTQSALSQQIKALEQELGCMLFERIGKRKIRLTPAGEKFLSFSAEILEKYDLFLGSLSGLKGVPQGPLRIAAPFTTLYHLCPAIFSEYANRFPQVQLTILDRPQKRAIELVRNGEVDFALALESLVPQDLNFLRWKQVETVLIVPPGHPLLAEVPITLEMIARYPLILPPKTAEHVNRLRVEERLQKLGVRYHVIMESSNVELSSVYVEMGLGISFATVVRELPFPTERRVEFLPLTHYFEPDHLAVIRGRSKALPPYKEALVSMLLQSQPNTEVAAVQGTD